MLEINKGNKVIKSENSGIYMIVTPLNKVYIGQSRNVKKRFAQYNSLSYGVGTPLNNELIKCCGLKNCKKEIIHHIEQNATDEKYDTLESFYINHYKKFGHTMINIRDGGKKGKHAQSTIDKISKHNKLNQNKTVYKKGHVHLNETLLKMSLAKKGKPSGRKGIKFSDEAIKRIRDGNKAKIGKYSGEKSCHAKAVIDLSTGEIYKTLMSAAEAFGIKRTTLGARLSGQCVNKTTLRWHNSHVLS